MGVFVCRDIFDLYIVYMRVLWLSQCDIIRTYLAILNLLTVITSRNVSTMIANLFSAYHLDLFIVYEFCCKSSFVLY